MSRTRTQTTLNKLAAMVANLHGELKFLDGLLSSREQPVEDGWKPKAKKGLPRTPAEWSALEARRIKLCLDREALYATVRQFDPEIDPGRIGSADEWRRKSDWLVEGKEIKKSRN